MDKKKLSGSVLILSFSIVLIHLYSCSKAIDPGPELSIQDVSQTRNITESTMRFHITLNKPATNSATVDYATEDGTAISQQDFLPATGTLSIIKDQTEATIDVLLKGDPLNVRQPNLKFTVTLSNPKNCTIKNASAKGTILTEDGTYLLTDNVGYTTPSHASKGANYLLTTGDYSKQFHVFSIVWQQNDIIWYVDDQKYLEVSAIDVGAANYPFNLNQFFIFNVAVGGSWPGSPDNTTAFPQRMFVDYVRVFQ